MTWTRPTVPLGTPAPPSRPWHYARSRSADLTVALCGAEWPTGLSEGKEACTPAARCPACEPLRSVAHATRESRSKVAKRGAAWRAAKALSKTQYPKGADD